MIFLRGARSRVRTWHDDEDGISLVETLVASFVLLVGMVAVLGVVVNSIVSSNRTRTTDLATQVANEQLESYRSLRYDSLALDTDDYTGAGTFEGYPVVTAAACDDADPDLVSCPAHSETVTRDGRDFDITRWVLAVDDAADGTGASDSDGETVDYKRVVVDVSWTQPQPGAHRIETNITDDEAGTPGPDDGVRFEVRRASDGTLIDEIDDYINFPVEVWKASVSYTNETIEGVADVLGIPQDTYFCTITRATPEWYPEGDPFATEDVRSCVVSDGVVTVTSTWVHDPCLSSGSLSENATITVVDGDDAPVPDASVNLTRDEDGTSYSGTTDANGEISWSALRGLYTVTATETATPLGTKSGRLCVSETGGAQTVTFAASQATGEGGTETSTCAAVADKAVICVEVTNSDSNGADRYFRLKIEPESGDKFYEPAKSPVDLEDKFHQGILVEAGQTYTIVRAIDPQRIKNIKLERADVKDNGERDWKKKAEWKDDEGYWVKNDGMLADTVYSFSKVVSS